MEHAVGIITMVISGTFILIAAAIIYKKCGYIEDKEDNKKTG